MSDKHNGFVFKLELSFIYTIIGILFLFSFSVGIVLLAPLWTEKSWISPTSDYQVQMYEVADPNFFISNAAGTTYDLQFVHRLIEGQSLLAFNETDLTRILAPQELEKFITRVDDKEMKLTSRLLMLRKPTGEFAEKALKLNKELQDKWKKSHPSAKEEDIILPLFEILELYAPNKETAFAVAATDGILENWAKNNYKILDESQKQKWHTDKGVIYVSNPREYLVRNFTFGGQKFWQYDQLGEPIASLEDLTSPKYGFRSRKDLIEMGENIYKVEGCWYCHTDQTRTLIQDTVLNGSDSFPAPPSTPNEYIYQAVTFPGTKRNGPDLSRVGIKKPSRDWHKGHFWSPKTASAGSIMPSFRHFFDFDPRGTASQNAVGVPNYKFEAIYQYLMTKGTRITAPSEGWWIGKDPVNTLEIIEGRRKIP